MVDELLPSERTPESVGSRLREERLRMGLTQEKAGELGGVRRVTVYQYEKGVRYPSLNFLCELAHKTDLDILYVTGGDRPSYLSADVDWVSAELLTSFFGLVDRYAIDEAGNSLDHDERSALFTKMVSMAKNRKADHVDVDAIVALLDDYPDPTEVIRTAIKKSSEASRRR